MKKTFIAVLWFFLFMGPAQAAELKFEWTQNISEDFAGWTLYRSSISGSGYSKLAEIAYSGNPIGAYESAVQMTLGEKETVYFVLTARDISGHESGYSNEVSYTSPDMPPGMPQELKLTIIAH
jgi:opacity protein-like surface antigen